MARPQASSDFGVRAEARVRARTRSTRARRLGVLALVLAIMVPILVLVFDEAEVAQPVPVPRAERLLPGGPPAPQVVALQDALRINLPVAQSKVTAVGYHSIGGGALALEPVGTQENAGVFTRLLRRLFGQEKDGIRFSLIEGGDGAETAGLDIGAPAGTAVYSPVDGTVIGITDKVIRGDPYGVRMDIQPSGNPGLVVSVENIEADEALSVGTAVAASRTKLGSIVDMSEVQESALARYTQDSGQHVHIEAQPAANLRLP